MSYVKAFMDRIMVYIRPNDFCFDEKIVGKNKKAKKAFFSLFQSLSIDIFSMQ